MSQSDFITEIQKHEPKMLGLAKSILRNEDFAKDGLQEVAIKLWSRLDDFSKVENKEAYCMRMIKNWCFDELKRKANNHLSLVYTKYEEQVEQEQIQETEEDSKPHNRFNTIECLVQELPDKQRIIIELKDFKGFDFEEIATLLEMEQGSVRVNLSRARKRIKKMYEALENKDTKTIQNEK